MGPGAFGRHGAHPDVHFLTMLAPAFAWNHVCGGVLARPSYNAAFDELFSRGSYPGYSADFFDGKHFVLKGGSWATAAELVRRSFRNWFQAHYSYVFATFRCVAGAEVRAR